MKVLRDGSRQPPPWWSGTHSPKEWSDDDEETMLVAMVELVRGVCGSE
jgi:hypothetical protein